MIMVLCSLTPVMTFPGSLCCACKLLIADRIRWLTLQSFLFTVCFRLLGSLMTVK